MWPEPAHPQGSSTDQLHQTCSSSAWSSRRTQTRGNESGMCRFPGGHTEGGIITKGEELRQECGRQTTAGEKRESQGGEATAGRALNLFVSLQTAYLQDTAQFPCHHKLHRSWVCSWTTHFTSRSLNCFTNKMGIKRTYLLQSVLMRIHRVMYMGTSKQQMIV